MAGTTLTHLTNRANRTFDVVLISKGDTYGLNDCLTHDKDDQLVEFWTNGHFISRYYASTLLPDLENGEHLCGLCLEGSDRELDLSGIMYRNALERIKAALA